MHLLPLNEIRKFSSTMDSNSHPALLQTLLVRTAPAHYTDDHSIMLKPIYCIHPYTTDKFHQRSILAISCFRFSWNCVCPPQGYHTLRNQQT